MNTIRPINTKAINRLRGLGYVRKIKAERNVGRGLIILERLLDTKPKRKILRLTFYPVFRDVKFEWSCESKVIGPLSMATDATFNDILKQDKLAAAKLLKALAN